MIRPRALAAFSVVALAVVSGYVIYQSHAAGPVTGDLNGDGTVNVFDLSILLSDWGTTTAAADLNHDGTVNVFDLSVLLSNWGQTGPSPSASPTATPSPTPPPDTFDDEFNGPAGSAPNSALWQNDVGGQGWGNQELEYYTDGSANSYLDGQGHLVIEADKVSGSGYQCWYGNCKYTSARVLTENTFAQAYGHFEARVEMPNLQTGLWPAFWMLGNNINTVGWPACGEMDIFENYGTDLVEASLHGNVPANDTADDFTTSSDDPTGWHTYSVDWTPTQVSYSIDGTVYGTHTKAELGADWAFDHPFFIILNMAVGGTGTGGKTPASLPGKMLVDYVRVSPN